MKVALIPPYCYLDNVVNRDYHLILPQHLTNPKYAETYAKVQGYKILDNGAAEDETIDWEELCRKAYMYNVHEIVLPDVIGNMQCTLAQSKAAMGSVGYYGPYKYMGVIQGVTHTELRRCIDVLINDIGVDTIGIPRWLCDHFSPNIRAEMAEYILGVYPGSDGAMGNPNIHFLGMSGNHPTEPWLLGTAFRNESRVRGIDTSAPYVFAHEGSRLKGNNTAHRQPGYFKFTQVWFDDSVVAENIKTLEGWVS
jgi:hypothetical protein